MQQLAIATFTMLTLQASPPTMVCEDFSSSGLGSMGTSFTTAPIPGYKFEFTDTAGVAPLELDLEMGSHALDWSSGLSFRLSEDGGDGPDFINFMLHVLAGDVDISARDVDGHIVFDQTVSESGWVTISSALPIAEVSFDGGDNETWLDNLCGLWF